MVSDFIDFGNILEDFEDEHGLAVESAIGQLFQDDEDGAAALLALIDANKWKKVTTKRTILKKAAAKAAQRRAMMEAESMKQREIEEQLEQERIADLVIADRSILPQPTMVYGGALVDLDGDCQKLNKALTSFITKKDIVVEVLSRRNQQQRNELKQRYNELFPKRDFDKDLTKNTRGDFCEFLTETMKNWSTIVANQLKAILDNKKMKIGDKTNHLLMLLATESKQRLAEIDDKYFQS